MDISSDLDQKSKELEERSKMLAEPMVVQLDIFLALVKKIQESEVLASIFGQDHLTRIGVSAISNDLRIIELGDVTLTDQQRKTFLAEVNNIIESEKTD